jgi:SprT protein
MKVKFDELTKEESVKNKILIKINECFKLANEYFLTCETIPVKFDLSGNTSGMFCVRGEEMYFRFNLQIAIDNEEEFIKQTIPHEVAHYLQIINYNQFKSGHGKAWKYIMQRVFNLEPKRCHEYNLTNVKKRNIKEFVYSCNCKEHVVSSIIHNRIQLKNKNYCCNICKSRVSFIREI